MLQTGLSHGVAIMPSAPKERYSCPITGAHFEFRDMCKRIERLEKRRAVEYNLTNEKKINKEFLNTQTSAMNKSNLDQNSAS